MRFGVSTMSVLRVKRFGAAAGLALTTMMNGPLAPTAGAADLGAPLPPPQFYEPGLPSPLIWSGFYLGLQAGYGWGQTKAVTRFPVGPVEERFSYSTSGFVGGGHAGFNWQSGNLVFGLESDIEGSGIEGSGHGNLGGRHKLRTDWLGSFRGRLGFAQDNVLFYATGGFAYGGVSVTRTIAGVNYKASDNWRTGWTAGGGVEYAFTPTATVRLEYRYTDLGQTNFNNSTVFFADRSDITSNAVRGGVSFRF